MAKVTSDQRITLYQIVQDAEQYGIDTSVLRNWLNVAEPDAELPEAIDKAALGIVDQWMARSGILATWAAVNEDAKLIRAGQEPRYAAPLFAEHALKQEAIKMALREDASIGAEELLPAPSPPTNQDWEVLALAALAKHGTNISACARAIGMNRKTFYYRMKHWPEFEQRFDLMKRENSLRDTRQVRLGQQVVTDVRDDEE